MQPKFKKGDIAIVDSPIRLYKITNADNYGYHATYIGPGTQTIDNALVNLEYNLAHSRHVRHATPAEIVLYVNSEFKNFLKI